MNLYLVRNGNTQWYCQQEQCDYWASQGYAVYELAPMQIAGPKMEVDGEEPASMVIAEASTYSEVENDETTVPVPASYFGGSDE